MAEAMAVIGLAASIAQLIAYGSSIAERLREFSVKNGEIPETFRSIAEQLPLLVTTLQQLRVQSDNERIDEITATALLPVMKSTLSLTEAIEDDISKVLPKKEESTFQQRMKALRSLSLDSKIADRLEKLRANIQMLVFHQTTRTADTADKILCALSELRIEPLNQPPAYQNQEPISLLQSLFIVPFPRDKNFVDRDVLDNISRGLEQPNARLGMVGWGGCGKSQIAIEYAYRIRESAPKTAILWVSADTTARIQQDFTTIAERLDLPGREDPQADLIALTYRRLSAEANTKWLLIIDNADDPRFLFTDSNGEDESELPKSEGLHQVAERLPVSEFGTILITSRSWDIARRIIEYEDDIFYVGTLDETDALRMFNKKLSPRVQKPRVEDVTRLCHTLGNLPLALSQAAALINQRAPRMNVSKYLEAYEKDDKARDKLLGNSLPDPRRNPSSTASIFATFQMSYKTINEIRPSATDLLSYIGMFDRTGVQERLLVGRYISREAQAEDSESVFEDDLALLQAYDLIKIRDDGDIEMHGLVQLATRNWLEKLGTTEIWYGRLIDTLYNIVPKSGVDNENEWPSLLPHVRVMESLDAPKDPQLLLKWALVLYHQLWYLGRRGRYQDAEAAVNKHLKALAALPGDHSRELLRGRLCLGAILDMRGKSQEGQAIVEDVLLTSIEKFGYDDAETTRAALYFKAELLKEQGDPEGAETILQHIADSPDYNGTITLGDFGDVEKDLATIYAERGDFEKAMAILQRTLAKAEQVKGPFHSDTISVKVMQSWVMLQNGRYAEMEKFLGGVLEEGSKHLKAHHPIIKGIRNNISLAMMLQNRVEEARIIQKELLEDSEYMSGPDSAETLFFMSNYGAMCNGVGDYETGIAWLRQVAEREERLHGPKQLLTLEAKYYLARPLALIGKYEESLQLSSEYIDAMEGQLGKPSNDLLDAETFQAVLYAYMQRPEKALKLSTSVVDRAKELHGDMAKTAYYIGDLAYILSMQGEQAQAEQRYREAESLHVELHGEDHATFRKTKQQWVSRVKIIEAKSLLEQHNPQQAQKVYEEGLAAILDKYGIKTPGQNFIVKQYIQEFETCKQKALEESKLSEEMKSI